MDREQVMPPDERRTAYAAVGQHWTHAEQLRWTLLYNFLVATTILLLAWAAVFASTKELPGKRPALFVLCVAGAVLSVIWVALVLRANDFVHVYASLGRDIEESLGITGVGPFTRSELARNAMTGLRGWAKSRLVTPIVPMVFGGIFTVLFFLSWRCA